MVVRSATKVTDKVIDAMDTMKFIVRGGVGLDNIDREAAKKKGIEVTNTPEASSISVAELSIGHMLSLCRHIPRGTSGLKGGKWEKKQLKGCEVFGKTLGLIGMGRIATEVARRASGLGMSVIAYDPYVKSVEGVDVKLVGLDELLGQADFISLHLPRTDETAHMLGKDQFAKMKDGVRLVNCARGGIIDEDALFDALQSGKVAGAAIDVFEKEPATDNKLFTLDNVIGTPHIGASTREGQGRVGSSVAEKIVNWAKSR
jgi:D-3-phosphoglycerate dehydrogenase